MGTNHDPGHPAFLGGLTCQEFLDKHWQKAPLFIPDAFPEWVDLLSPDELAGFALEDVVESRIIREISPTTWELHHGPFDEATFQQLPETQWTLLIQALDHYIPELAKLLDQFNFLPQWRIDDLMMSYAVPGGSVGPHYDYYDVFLIQISGQRRWQIGQPCDDQTRIIPDLPIRVLEDFHARGAWVVNPGDVLYLPPGIAHHGVALDDQCMTLSVGFRAPAWSEVISEYSHAIANELGGQDRYQDQDLMARQGARHHAGLLSDRDIDRFQQHLSALLDNRDQLTRWLGSYLSLPKYEQLPLQTCDMSHDMLVELLEADKLFQRDENSRFIWTGAQPNALYVNGEPIPYPDTAAPLAELVTTKRQFSGLELQALLTQPESAEWLLSLVQCGLIYCYDQ